MVQAHGRLARPNPRLASCLLVALAWHAAGASAARADISRVDMFRNITNLQTADGSAGVASTGAFVNLELTSVHPGDYSAVTVDVPPIPDTLNVPNVSPTFFALGKAFPNQAAMDSAYPMGTYTFNATQAGGGGTDAATLDYKADDYSRSTPYLAGTSFSDLQNYNPSTSLHIQFSPDVVGNNTPDQYIFFTIRDAGTGALVYDAGFLPPTTTGVDLAAGTLLASHDYTFELDFSNRDATTGSGATFAPFVGFDLRTDGVFTTRAVPEPASMILLAQAGIGAAWAAMRKRGRKGIA